MPLPSSVHQDGAIPEERDHHITHEDGKWVLRSKSTGKVLGTHPTKEAAEAQERAVQANKHSEKEGVEHDFGGPGSGRYPAGSGKNPSGGGLQNSPKVGDRVKIPPSRGGQDAIRLKITKVDKSGVTAKTDTGFEFHISASKWNRGQFSEGSDFKKVTLEDMRSICSPCADKMIKDGVKHFYLDTAKEDLGLPIAVDSEVSERLRQFVAGDATATKELKGVEIFASGTWNGDSYTDKDLDTLVNSFKATKDSLKPYLKLGHSEDQALLAEDSLPAAGWVTNIYRVGHKLLADFCDIPNKIADLIKARAYKRVSSEIFVNINVDGKKYPYALKAVALLGGETPAVQTLDDIHALYALDQTVLAFNKQAESRAYQFDPAEIKEEYTMEIHVKDGAPDSQKPGRGPEEKDNALPLAPAKSAPAVGGASEPDGDECYSKLAAAYAEVDGYKKQMAAAAPKAAQLEGANQSYKLKIESLTKELSDTQSELVKATSELKKIYSEKTAAEVKSAVEKFVQEKKILPSQAPALEHLLILTKETGVRKFKVGEKEFSSAEDLVKEFISNGQVGLSTEAKSENGKDIAAPDLNDGVAVDLKVKEYMAKSGEKSYTKAYIAVAAALGKAKPKNS